MKLALEATVSDLPLAGNYFAGNDYLHAEPNSGMLRNRGGVRMVALPDDLLAGIYNAIEEVAGAKSGDVQAAIGRRWGAGAAEHFARELQAFYGKPLAELPFGLAVTAMRSAFRAHGWGTLHLDSSRYATGILIAELHHPVIGGDARRSGQKVEAITAGYLAAFFSNWAGRELGCMQTTGPSADAPLSRFVITIPQRLNLIREWADTSTPHDEIIAKLESTPAE